MPFVDEGDLVLVGSEEWKVCEGSEMKGVQGVRGERRARISTGNCDSRISD